MSVTPNRRPDIQGLRAVAVLMVVAFHAGLPVPGGFVGVDVFFVISGFVITAMLMREWARTGRIQLARFYVRRFKRLTPALALTVAVVMLASVVLLSPRGGQQIAAQTAIGALLLTANVVIARSTGGYFDAPAESNPLLNTWSLSVEEQFYLAFPAVLLVGWLLGRRAKLPRLAPVVVVGLVGAVSFAMAVAGSLGIQVPFLPDSLAGFYGPITRAWEFAAGALLALGGARLKLGGTRLALPLAILGTGVLAASLWAITGTTPFPSAWTLLPVGGTLLLLAAGSSGTVIDRVLASRQMVTIGDLSYSIYLWHWPFIVFAKLLWPGSPLVLPLAAVLSLLPAYASYRWVEEPIRALPQAGRVSFARLVAATVVPPLALAGALGFAARNGYWIPAVTEYQVAMKATYASRVAGCHTTTPMDQLDAGECLWNESAGGKPIYLVGDSNADHFSNGVLLAAETLGRPLMSSTASACPFVNIPLASATRDSAANDQCREYVTGTLRHLVSATPGTVIMSASDGYWRSTEHSVGGAFEEGVKLSALSDGLTSTVNALKAAGHTVLLVQSIPRWEGEDSLRDCSLMSLLGAEHGCSQDMPRDRALERQGAVRSVVSSVSDETGAALLDPWVTLCSENVCASAEGKLLRYRDGTHITVEQSRAFSAAFTAAIAAAG